jgi:hypothetical protein
VLELSLSGALGPRRKWGYAMLKQRTVTVGFLGLVVLFASSAFAAQHRPRHAQKPAQITTQAPAPAPPIPSVPARESAVPPQVSYENGQLLIDAKNSTLRDILAAVEKNTGATFDISSGDTSERVVGRLGPGPARDVMTDLLNGSHFNYVMLSPANDPSALSRVVLTARGSVPPQAGGQNEPPQFPQQFQPQPGMPNSVAAQVQPQDPNAPDANQDNADNTDDANADNPDQAEEAQPDQSAQQEGVKTPEQLLQDLQRQQQIIQQQQLRPGTIVQPQQNQ